MAILVKDPNAGYVIYSRIWGTYYGYLRDVATGRIMLVYEDPSMAKFAKGPHLLEFTSVEDIPIFQERRVSREYSRCDPTKPACFLNIHSWEFGSRGCLGVHPTTMSYLSNYKHLNLFVK